MNVGLIAHDSKKKLMQNFCIAYKGILCKHNLYATGTTGKLIEEVTNLNVHKYLPGHLGGEQQMGAQIESNDMDLVIFLRDPLSPKSHEPDVNKAVRLCDIHNVPLATNLATAELLIKALGGEIWNGGKCTNDHRRKAQTTQSRSSCHSPCNSGHRLREEERPGACVFV